jgi:hypothetical protein
MAFEPNETIAVVAGRKAAMLFPFVFERPFLQVIRNADVERMTSASHDVREIGSLVHGRMLSETESARCDKGNRRSFAYGSG